MDQAHGRQVIGRRRELIALVPGHGLRHSAIAAIVIGLDRIRTMLASRSSSYDRPRRQRYPARRESFIEDAAMTREIARL